MKNLIALFALISTVAQAAPMEGVSLTTLNKQADVKYGVYNYKPVMPGVLYRGGSTTSTPTGQQAPLSSSSQQALCNDGFDAAVYAYPAGWSGGDKSIRCANGQMTYVDRRWDHPNEVHDVMAELHNIIVEGKGAMYVHCYYGVHASGFLATVALMQFCGLKGQAAIDYWDSNVPAKIRYPKVHDMINAYRVDPALAITPEQAARVCPSVAAYQAMHQVLGR